MRCSHERQPRGDRRHWGDSRNTNHWSEKGAIPCRTSSSRSDDGETIYGASINDELGAAPHAEDVKIIAPATNEDP
jgi:hypothetical protein